MCASFETLRAVPSVEEERFILLDLRKLVFQTLDLPTPFHPNSGKRFETANLPQKALPTVEGLQFWITP